MTTNRVTPSPAGQPIGKASTDLLGDTFTVIGSPEWHEDSEGNGMWTQDVDGPCGVVRMSVQSLGFWS